MLTLDRPLGRLRFVLAGVVLMAAKGGVDMLVLRAYGRSYSPLLYISPTASTLFDQSGAPDRVLLAIFAWSIPFMAIGLVLTLRRLRDAGLPASLGLLFFVPFAKFLFFVVCASVPSRDPGTAPTTAGDAPYRVGTLAGRGPAPLSPGVGFAVATSTGLVVGLGSVGVSVWLLRSYGVAMFLFTPAIASLTTALVLHRLVSGTKGGRVALATVVVTVASLAVMVATAFEGAICLVMASPIIVLMAAIGAMIGHSIATSVRPSRLATPGTGALMLLPMSFAAEQIGPIGDVESAPIESVVIVDAPPDVVWKRVVSFPPLDPPTELLFRAGVAAPMSATIAGSGVGAIRRCEFTTGPFIEPIDTWDENRELGFSVASEPDPMRERILWPGPRPPHLDGYIHSTRGQFVLEPLPGGKTRLVGRTWYAMKMAPAAYWRLWGDAMIHTIHMRVLEHVARLAEHDARAP